MKKIISAVFILLICLSVFTACGSGISQKSNKLSVAVTIFPEYDWLMNVLCEKAADADVTLLLDNGVDLHSYQPSAADIIKISSCDLFICVGGESDKWVNDALKEATNEDMKILRLLDVLGEKAKLEETVEGMESEDEEEAEYDEHIWLSPKNAKIRRK